MTTGDAAPRRRTSIVPAIVAGLAVAGLLVVPQILPLPSTAAGAPVFPRAVSPYSWWTSPLAPGDMERATVVYQNGVGVEFMDYPQSIVLGEDGGTYRRLTAAEGRSTVEDQGDPAATLLAPDGSFVVVGSGTRIGQVAVVDLADGAERDLPIDEGRAAVPLSITSDGATVLLLVGDAPMSRYADANFQLNGALITLDLVTGDVAEHSAKPSVHGGAISPDGSKILIAEQDGIALVDVATGVPRAVPDVGRGALVAGSAFSPSSERFAVSVGSEIRIHDSATGEASGPLALPGFEYAAAVGWRDDDTLLVQGATDGEGNLSAFAWLDATSGELDIVSTYTPDATGAAMWVTSVASELVPSWTFADTRDDRGYLQILVSLAVAAAAGGLVRLLTPRRRARPVPMGHVDETQPAERAASVV